MNKSPYTPPNSPVKDIEYDPDDALVTIQSYSFPHEAHVEKSFLESEGVPVFLIGEHLATGHFFLSNAGGGIKLQVPSAFAEQAAKLLDEFDHGEFELDDDQTDFD